MGFEPDTGATIGEIRFVRQNIFDLKDPEEDNWLFRLVNRFHVLTRESTIRDQLLFDEGDAFVSAGSLTSDCRGIGNGFGFLLETLATLGVRSHFRRKDFEGDLSVELGVLGDIDFAHPSSAELF